MKAKYLVLPLIIMTIGATTARLMSNKSAVENKIYRPDATRKILVEGQAVSSRLFEQQLTYTGTFTPNRETMIIPQAFGEVTHLYFNEGDVVRSGQLLAKLDDDLLRAQHIAAKANYENAIRNMQRFENAAITGGVSQQQVDNATLNTKTTDSQLRQLNKQIDLTRIEAPFSGTITMRDVEIGAVVGSQPIAMITDLSVLKLEIAVPEIEVTRMKKGDIVNIETTVFPGEQIKGQIEYISSRGDGAHNYMVRIVVKNAQKLSLKAGMYGNVVFNQHQQAKTLAIPRESLIGSSKTPQVFVMEAGKAHLRSIQTGQANEAWIEVIDGIEAGDTVITSGHINIAEGTLIQLANQKQP